MPLPADCLVALIGLSQNGTDCFSLPPAPEGGDLLEITGDDDTRYYMEQLLEFKVVGNNPATDLYNRLNNARKLAAQNLRGALKTATGAYVARGAFGDRAHNGSTVPAGPVVFDTHYREGGSLRITSLRLLTTQTEADVVLLLDGAPVAVLPTTNGAAYAVNLLIPLDGERHTLEAQLSTGNLAFANKLFCPGCAGLSEWGKAVGKNLRGVTNTTLAQGFVLQVQEQCGYDPADLICYATQYEDLRQQLAQALVYMAAEVMLTSLITDTAISRYTMLEPKSIPALAAKYAATAAESVAWLNSSAGLGRLKHPCYTCAPGVFQGSISNVANR